MWPNLCLSQILFRSHFVVTLKSHLHVQQTHLRFWGWFLEQKFMLSSSFRCDQIHNYHRYNVVVTLRSDSDVQQPHLSLLNKSSCLAPELGVTKFIIVTDMIFGHTLLSHLGQTLRLVCRTSKSDLSSTRKWELTPKAWAKHESFFQQTGLWGQRPVCWTFKSDLSSTTKCDWMNSFDYYEFGHT